MTYFLEWITGISEDGLAPKLNADGQLVVGVSMVPVGVTAAQFIEQMVDEVGLMREGRAPTLLSTEQWELVTPERKRLFQSGNVDIVVTAFSPAADSR